MANPTLAQMQAAGMTPEQIAIAMSMISAGLTMPIPMAMPPRSALEAPTVGAPNTRMVRAGTSGAAPVAPSQLLQAQANAVFTSGQAGFVSTDRVNRIDLDAAIQQVHAFVAKCKTGGGDVDITRYMSEEQMIAELEKNYRKTRIMPVQGTNNVSTLGGVEVQQVALPSGRVWSADKRGIDDTVVSSAPNKISF